MATRTNPASLTRLQAFQGLLTSVSERMGSHSPDSVLKNFIHVLQSASPRLKLAIAFLTPWALLGTAITQYTWVEGWFHSIKRYVSGLLFASVSVPSSHPLNKQLLAYMADHGLGKNARTLALASPAQSHASSYLQETERLLFGTYHNDLYSSKRGRALKSLQDERTQKSALNYVPEIGRYSFWFRWHCMTFERKSTLSTHLDREGRQTLMPGPAGTENIIISCISPFSGAKPIQDLLRHIQEIPAAERTTSIYRPDAANMIWDQGITRPSRYLNAVTLDRKVKDDLVKDMQTYLSPATRKYYANRGIPYRRGYLFYGTPGCGKTSFSNALAGHFGLNIYMFSLSNVEMTDVLLETLFEQLPSRCIVLLEDIDSAGLKRENMRGKPKKKNKKNQRSDVQLVFADNRSPVSESDYDEAGNLVRKPQVTLSGLLNVLDGIRSKEGIITIMTSNSPDNLDPALVRPGRIDRKILFGHCSTQVLADLFKHIFERAPEEIAEGETNHARNHDIAALATNFASQIPANKLSPAEVQGFLLMHRGDPVAAVEQVADWAKTTIDLKAAGANVASFENEIQDPANREKSDSDKYAKELSSESSSTDSTASTAKAPPFNLPGNSPMMGSLVSMDNGVQAQPSQAMKVAQTASNGVATRMFVDLVSQLPDVATPPMSRPPSRKD